MSTENQKTVGGWISTTFPGTDPESPRKSIRCLEEMVELCRASGASPRAIRDGVERALGGTGGFSGDCNFEPEKVPAEAADVLIVLYGVAHMRGFDLGEEVDKKMAVNRARTWKANGDGTGYHVKAAELVSAGP